MLRALTLIVLAGVASAAEPVRPVSRQEYLAYMTAAADSAWNGLAAEHAKWAKSIDVNYVFGYNPPGTDPYLAALCANIYELTKDEKYLDRVKPLLLEYGRFRDAYPPDYQKKRPEFARGIPALPNIFTFGKYVHAYEVLKRYRTLSRAEKETIDANIAGSADYMIVYQEWGPMNRALLRAEAIGYAAKVLVDHPKRAEWEMYSRAIGDDNWGTWEIEDATGYHGVWLYALLSYASDVREDESVYRTPVLHYYFDYMLSLMSPAGIIPDFGDADWQSGWDRFLVFFEKGGAIYKDPRYRWAAATIFRKYLDPMPKTTSVFTGLILSDACRWADFSVDAQTPVTMSQEVLEDVVGKKVVFRNGWQPTSTYMLYNYRDIGDGGWLPREYLRTTIPVEEEKMHHGHSDENSIALLMHKGSILLHESGYRDFMPSGPFGAYRADYFHNRLVVRDGKIALGQKQGEYRYASPGQAPVAGQEMLDFFRNSGAYRDVRTLKIDFQTTRHADISRSRIVDDHLGYEADRTIVYMKEASCFLVVDAVRFTRPGYLTMASLWHTRQVFSSGPGWYDTGYDSLRQVDVRGDQRLLVLFPQRSLLVDGVTPQRRYYQDEKTIYQMVGRHGYRNDIQLFVTVLQPHDAGVKPEELVGRVRLASVDREDRAVALTVQDAGRTYFVGLKLDLEQELVRDWRRPMYTYESGRTTYGDFETDGQSLVAVQERDSLWYAVSGFTKLAYRGKVLHEQPGVLTQLSFDGTADKPGVGKMRRWEGVIRLSGGR